MAELDSTSTPTGPASAGSTTVAGGPRPPHPADSPGVQAADRWLLVGAMIAGTLALAPIGLIVIAIGLRRIKAARAGGEVTRPTAVTIFGLFMLIDASLNFVGWSIDLIAHDTHVLQAISFGFGRMVDGGYYYRYNSTSLGGTAAAGEKGWQFFGILLLFPVRVVAAWAFIKLKRWGFRWIVMTSWAYLMIWTGYLVNVLTNFGDRMGNTLYGAAGWWVFDIWYMTPFLTLPWIYALDKRRWDR